MKRRFEQVAVLMGGVSSEREVSLRSGAAAARGLRESGYRVEEVDVTERAVELPPETEAVFIALHGVFGEDGEVQRLLEELGVPYTGSRPAACRLAFDKILTRGRLEASGIPVAPGEVLREGGKRTLPLPVVVKPPREGSSVGCHIVFDEAEWEPAFRDVLRYGEEALVERYIPGRELTVGILDGEPLPVVEIRAARRWYDFEAKYLSGDTRYIVPAELDEATARRVQEIARETFRVLDAEGFGRVDLRLSPEGEPFVLELNTIPGLTASSLLPKAAAAAGIAFPELCSRIMESARL